MNSIFHRRSIRKFQDRPVEKEKTEMILKAAMASPSTGNQQPWLFTVVKNKDKIAALSKASPFAGCAAGAEEVIVVSYKTTGIHFPDWAQIDCAIAMENMWLEADDLGLGAVWLGIAPVEERMAKVDQVIGNPSDVRAFALFALGYPGEEKTPEDHYDPARVSYID